MGNFDLIFEDNDVAIDQGLATAALISLFSDRRANDDDALPDNNDTDKRGWWGDAVILGDTQNFIGSRIWLLSRSTTTNENLEKLKEYALEALNWMIEDGIAAKVEVETFRAGSIEAPRMDLLVRIFKNNGDVFSIRFDSKWENTITSD